MAVPTYKYGKVTGLFPDLTVVTETTESPWVCCGWTSAQMAALTAKKGLSTSMKVVAHEMRAKGGRAHNAGANAAELRAGARAAVDVRLVNIAIADIRDRLRKGFSVVLNIQYSKLPSWLKTRTNDFGHSVTLFGFKEEGDHCGFFDPLWSQGARGAWTPWSQITPALWPDGNHSTTVVKLVQAGGGPMAQRGITTTTPKLILIKKDQDIFDLDGTTKVGDSAMERVDVMSPCGRGSVSDGRHWREWYIDLDGSGTKPRQSVLSRINPDDIKDVPASGGASDAELLAAKQAGYDLAMSPFPPRPK